MGGHELQVDLIVPNIAEPGLPAPPTDWDFLTPQEVLVPEPQIVITPDQEAGEGIVASGILDKLPPRLDPRHVNERPELPATMGDFVARVSLELRLFVLADGSVGTAEIVRSCGQHEIDELALDWVKNSWRYLPATINGKPTAQWTNAVVRFAPIS